MLYSWEHWVRRRQNFGHYCIWRPKKIMFSKMINDKFYISLGTTSNLLCPAINVFDIHDVANSMQALFLPPARWQKRKLVTDIFYRAAFDHHIIVFETIRLFIRSRWLAVLVSSCVVDNLLPNPHCNIVYSPIHEVYIFQQANERWRRFWSRCALVGICSRY